MFENGQILAPYTKFHQLLLKNRYAMMMSFMQNMQDGGMGGMGGGQFGGGEKN